MNIQVSQDFNKLVELLNSQTKDDYPYVMDYFFKTDQIDSNSYCLFGWEDNNIVATYAYRKLSFKDYMVYWSNVFSKFNGENFNPSIPGINQWYSSCQWVHKDYRNKGIGVSMDARKKEEIWAHGGDINYANCRVSMKDYHLNTLKYDESVELGNFTNPSGEFKDYLIVYKVAV